MIESYFSAMVPPSRGTSVTARLGGTMAHSLGVATLTSERIWEAGMLDFLGTNAYGRRHFT